MVEQTHDMVKATLHRAPPTSPALSPPAPHPHLTPELCQSARFPSMELPWTVTSAWTAQAQFLGLLSFHVGLRWGAISSSKTPSPTPAPLLCPITSCVSIFTLTKLCQNYPSTHLSLALDQKSYNGPSGSDLALRQNHALFGLHPLGQHHI